MPHKDRHQKGFDGELKAFERSLALYKARVHETYCFDAPADDAETTALAIQKSNPTKPVILVVEDNPDEWFLIRWALLQLFPTIQPVWLSEASEVIPYLNSRQQQEMDMPRLILVDLYMPGAQVGLDVLQRLKSHPDYKHIPAITMSRSNDANDVVNAFTYSANSYIVKPTTYSEWREGLNPLRSYWNEAVKS